MIIVDMKGNIGNQMFIYAVARKIQEETNDTICVNTYYLKKNYPSYKFNLNIFKLNDNVIFDNKKIPFFASSESKFFKIFRRLTFNISFFQKLYFKLFSLFNIFVWNGTTYQKINIKKSKNIYLSGYWQCPKYFDDIKHILVNEFSVKENVSDKNKILLNEIINSESVCVSIRRGDYLSNPQVKKFHYLCDETYFKKAIDKIKTNIKNPTIFCFSDDPQWVQENIKFDCKTIYENIGNTLIDKLILMENCKHFVLSNSSFSWWVEFLSVNEKNKIVIAPNNWYANKQKADIYEPYWLTIEV